jgi:hypothetical protein
MSHFTNNAHVFICGRVADSCGRCAVFGHTFALLESSEPKIIMYPGLQCSSWSYIWYCPLRQNLWMAFCFILKLQLKISIRVFVDSSLLVINVKPVCDVIVLIVVLDNTVILQYTYTSPNPNLWGTLFSLLKLRLFCL